MCGLCGYIGQSTDPAITHRLITALFIQIEKRGRDAAGMWGTEVGGPGILFAKKPVPSGVFVTQEAWKQTKNLSFDLLLLHARAASLGSGSPQDPRNNHPFVSRDRTVGLIHNGRIPETDYRKLKKVFPCESDCDSELFLRIFESAPDRLISLEKIWRLLPASHMALAIGEAGGTGRRQLWLSRNRHRTLWLADARGDLGQIFFFSTPDLWQQATLDAVNDTIDFSAIRVWELPPEQIWSFSLLPGETSVGDRSIHSWEVRDACLFPRPQVR